MTDPKPKRKPLRRKAVRIEVEQGGRRLSREDATAVLAVVNANFAANRERRERSRLQRRLDRVPEKGDQSSIAKAIILIEDRLAKAFWAIAQQTSSVALRPSASSQHGIAYLHDHVDNYARYSDAPSGDWKSAMPAPSRPIPSGKEIDAAAEAQSWLLYVDQEDRKLFIVGVTSKRGDAGRNINWKRLKEGRPELADIPIRTLQARYQNALRSIVLGLALAQAA